MKQRDPVDIYVLARLAYQTYGETVRWKNYQGNDMPLFDALPHQIKEAWRRACVTVLAEQAR